MKIVLINSVPYGSTGKIMFSLSEKIKEHGNEVRTFSGFSWKKIYRNDHLGAGGFFSKAIHKTLSHLTGLHGYYSYFATQRLIKRIDEFKPNVIHLHNIHGWYLNVSTLFEYLKENNIPIIWTLHDCWAFTGGCAHFAYLKCNKWTNGCSECPNLALYPIQSRVDRTSKSWKDKEKWFKNINSMTIVTPSNWLAELTERSFLRTNEIRVIHNGINIDVFKPRESGFKEKLNIPEETHVVLGVSLGWGERKGLDVFIELSRILNEKKFKIILVGTDEEVDKMLPDNIISIHCTYDQSELAEIYSAADVFVNPTREDNFPTVNLEALACGTPVITFRTGGSPECIDETCGSVIECDDMDALEKEIVRVCEIKPYSKEACRERAGKFDMNERFEEYIKLYETIGIR